MNRTIAFAALSVAVVLGGTSAALAGHKHHGAKALPMDPREAYQAHAKGGWCNINPSCNGWDAYWQGVHAKKKYAPTGIVIGRV